MAGREHNGTRIGISHAKREIQGQVAMLIGHGGSGIVGQLMNAYARHVSDRFTLVVAAMLIVVYAVGLFMQVQNALDDIWEIPVHLKGGFLLQALTRASVSGESVSGDSADREHGGKRRCGRGLSHRRVPRAAPSGDSLEQRRDRGCHHDDHAGEDGQTVADSRAALTMRECDYPAVQYIPRADVAMSLLQRTGHATY